MKTFTLPSIVDRVAVEALIAEVSDVLNGAEGAAFDGSQVARIGQCGLQFLVSAAVTAAERGGAFRIDDPSEPLTAALALSGLAPALPIAA